MLTMSMSDSIHLCMALHCVQLCSCFNFTGYITIPQDAIANPHSDISLLCFCFLQMTPSSCIRISFYIPKDSDPVAQYHIVRILCNETSIWQPTPPFGFIQCFARRSPILFPCSASFLFNCFSEYQACF